MYCSLCKTELNTDSKYCPNCGNAIAEEVTPKNQGFQNFIDGRIKTQTTFLSALDFLQGAKPKLLRYRWVVILLAGLVTIPGLGVGALLAWVVSYFASGVLMSKQNAKTFSMPPNASLDIQAIGTFLSRNLQQFPFSEWQAGNPSTFGLVASDILIIQCKFNNKTIHRIWFDTKKANIYKITVFSSSGKERLKNGGKNNPVVLYKAAYVVQPILAAAVEYYFQQKKEA